LKPTIHPSRYEHLNNQFEQPYFSQIKDFLVSEKQAGKIIYPAGVNIFKAFDLTPWDSVKIVILWQDPYHGPGQAMGLSFSVPGDIPLPPSLKNIYKELLNEGFSSPLIKGGRGDLTRRAEQWVLLLNSILTVRTGEPASHSKIWRQMFTDEVIRQIALKKSWIVFMLRWNYAISKKSIIENAWNSPSLSGEGLGWGLILTGVHPSPLSASRGRFGCNHFRLCNEYLISQGEKPIQR